MPRLTVLGSGDAFGSGGRLFSAYLLEGQRSTVLLECGPTVLQGLKRIPIDTRCIDVVLVSHLHGDHFGGLPFLFMEYIYETPRVRPLRIYGPPGIAARSRTLFDALYRKIADGPWPFPVEYHEIEPARGPISIDGIRIAPFEVPHVPELTCLGYRLDVDGRTLCFSGDTGWTERLVEAAAGADLFLCECSTYDTRLDIHVAYPEIAAAAPRLGCKRLVLTHLGREPLERLGALTVECAVDGMTIEF